MSTPSGTFLVQSTNSDIEAERNSPLNDWPVNQYVCLRVSTFSAPTSSSEDDASMSSRHSPSESS
eukprot:11189956-Lingulodinium_polyedra.AAC.1